MRPVAYVLAGLLAAAAIVVIGVKIHDALNAPSSKPVVHDHTLVVQTPVLTPLPRDSGPKNNQRPGTLSSPRTRLIPQTVSRKPQNRPLPSRKRQATKTRPDRRPSRPAAQKPPSGSNPPPAPPKQCPPVNLGVPVPLTVMTPAASINC